MYLNWYRWSIIRLDIYKVESNDCDSYCLKICIEKLSFEMEFLSKQFVVV